MKNTPASPVREIRRSLFLHLHRDGLMDLLAGLVLVAFGFVPILDETGMNPGVRQLILLFIWFAGFAAFLLLKNHVVQPRAGTAVFPVQTRRKAGWILLSLNGVAFIVFLGIVRDPFQWFEGEGDYRMPLLLGAFFMGALTLAGAMTRALRFYLYGIGTFALFIGSGVLFHRGAASHYGLPLACFFSGGLILTAGGILFTSFLSRNKPEGVD